MLFRTEKLTPAEKEVISKIEEARRTLKYNLGPLEDGRGCFAETRSLAPFAAPIASRVTTLPLRMP